MTRKKWLIMVLLLGSLDQFSKLFVTKQWPNLVEYNTGSAFSAPVPLWFTISLSLVIIGGVSWYVFKHKNLQTPCFWIVTLITAGAIGNLIDRIRLNHVIDFIDLGFFPVFNFADIYLTTAAILLLWFYVVKSYNHNDKT